MLGLCGLVATVGIGTAALGVLFAAREQAATAAEAAALAAAVATYPPAAEGPPQRLAAEFARRGYRAMALNTARTDLSALGATDHPTLSEAQRLYIGIDGYDGAGADLKQANRPGARS